jgi:putative PIN family toxin of toxin-antitoxin system
MPFVVAVDTNIWVSAFLTPHGYLARIRGYWHANRFGVVLCMELLTELAQVLTRPKLQTKYGYSTEEVTVYLRSVAELANIVKITGTLNLCRDSDDDMLIETAITGNATHIISRDEDITRDANVVHYLEERGIQALTISRFLRELEESR